MYINKKGFSLIEILVALGIIGVISVVVTSTVLTTIRGSKRSDSDAKIRENLSFALGTIERHLRNATTVVCLSTDMVSFTDNEKDTGYFYLTDTGSDIYIASQGASLSRLTSQDVRVNNLVFICTDSVGNQPASVDIVIDAEDAAATGAEKAQVNTSTKVIIRTNF